jgi:hypothetical protein
MPMSLSLAPLVPRRPSMTRATLAVAIGVVLTGSPLWVCAQETKAADTKAPAAKTQRRTSADINPSLLQRDFPYTTACVGAKGPGKNVALKGIALILGNEAYMCFDTDLLRMAAGWSGMTVTNQDGVSTIGYITTHGVAFDGGHGRHPEIAGAQKFGTTQTPGWADAKGEFADPRSEPFGPLPQDWCRWDGLHVNGMDVVLAYTVHGTKILEQPSSVQKEGETGFVRTFKTEQARQNLSMQVCTVEGATGKSEGHRASLAGANGATVAMLAGAPKDATLAIAGNSIVLKLPKGTAPSLFKLVIWSGATEDNPKLAALLEGKPAMVDIAKGGPAHWPEPVVTRGVLNTSTTPDGAYATDSLTAPLDNPWKRRVRFAGMDFFADGKRAAFCTHEGDVWIVSGIDEGLEKLTWRRFASGMYETLGLVIVNDVIYTSGRDQVTRYHDLNGDGEADFYENFNNQVMSSEGFHEFVFDLQTDKAGNFYFAKANPVNGGGRGFGDQARSMGNGTVTSHSGCLFKLGKDGKKLEVIARGLRAPNGIGVRDDGQVTTSDNQGTWVPATPINWVTGDGFLGVSNRLTSADMMSAWRPPLSWLAHTDYDNSGGGQVWVTSDKWGPFKGELLHESYGRSSLFLVMKETLSNGLLQGGVVRFPLKFTSSVMRAHFNPRDGQLYVAGLREWQSNAAMPAGFDRVRYTGKPVYSVNGIKVVKGGVQLSFTQPLSTASASDLQNFSAKRWNYERAENYGSPEFSTESPARRGRDTVNITGTKLSQDGRTLTVEIPDLKPVMQQALKFNLTAADGTPIAQEVQHTIHAIP